MTNIKIFRENIRSLLLFLNRITTNKQNQIENKEPVRLLSYGFPFSLRFIPIVVENTMEIIILNETLPEKMLHLKIEAKISGRKKIETEKKANIV